MPEWWIEKGIGETRRVLVEEGRIVEARILPDDRIAAGSVLDAKLVRAAGRNAVAVAQGSEFLLPDGAPGVTEGARFRLHVTRESLGGAEPWKRPLARVADPAADASPDVTGKILSFPAPADPLDATGWPDLLDEARSGVVPFPGGALRFALTPAMTLIDVDGPGDPASLAVAGARAAALAIRRHGVGGSIGIDLPTVAGRAGRQAVAAEIDRHLVAPFERTAVNGFGFVQIVRARAHASVFELAADRAAFEARALLRLAARNIGPVVLTAHPAVLAALRPHWLDALAGQVGGDVTLRPDGSRAMSAGDAQRA